MTQLMETKILNTVCSIVNGGTPKTSIAEYWGDHHLWITPKDMGKLNSIYVNDTSRKITDAGLANSSAKLLPINAVILSSRAPIGHLAIAEKPISTNQGCKGIIPSESVDSKYLFYFLKKSVKLLNDLGSGTTFKELSGSKLGGIEMPIPPLPEQKRIVAKLDQTFEAIDKAKANVERNLQNAKDLFQSQLNDVFSPKDAVWIKCKLDEVVDTSCSLSYGIVQPGDEYPSGLPVVRPTDLSSKYIKVDGLKRINPKLADGYKRTSLRGNELLLCVRGSTGVVSIAEKELNGANVTRGIVPILFNSSSILQQFGYYLLISPFSQRQIKAKTYGAALMQINIRDLRKLEVIHPVLSEQQIIINRLDSFWIKSQALEASYISELAAIDELKKSILQKAFSGEL
jgi:type I restriction enzyme, S subunit